MRLEGPWQAIAARLIASYIHLVAWTGRWRTLGDEAAQQLIHGRQPVLLSFWHGRLLMIPYAYQRAGGRNVHILISEHRDGELIARTMAHWGYQAVRGSTRQGAAKGLRGMLRIARSGGDLAITPDGPRGPCEVLQPGVLEIARLARLPIVPVSFSARWAKTIGSWDRFLLPLPFTRGVILWGEPVWIPEEADSAQIQEIGKRLEIQMRSLSVAADQYTKEGH